jgi:hypothetical protein
LFVQTTQAKSTREFAYPFDTVWSTAVRLLRVDRGYKISDKDKDSGYILFTFPGTGSIKECAGSMELVPIKDDQGAKRIRSSVNLAHQPGYIELALLEKLDQKLRLEQGRPSDADDRNAAPVAPPRRTSVTGQ